MPETSEDALRPLILAVDDSSDNLWVLSGLLKDQYQLKLAGSGEKALQIARSIPAPDLILLDVMMPGLSGYEVCRQLKEAPATRAFTAKMTMRKIDVAAIEAAVRG